MYSMDGQWCKTFCSLCTKQLKRHPCQWSVTSYDWPSFHTMCLHKTFQIACADLSPLLLSLLAENLIFKKENIGKPRTLKTEETPPDKGIRIASPSLKLWIQCHLRRRLPDTSGDTSLLGGFKQNFCRRGSKDGKVLYTFSSTRQQRDRLSRTLLPIRSHKKNKDEICGNCLGFGFWILPWATSRGLMLSFRRKSDMGNFELLRTTENGSSTPLAMVSLVSKKGFKGRELTKMRVDNKPQNATRRNFQENLEDICHNRHSTSFDCVHLCISELLHLLLSDDSGVAKPTSIRLDSNRFQWLLLHPSPIRFLVVHLKPLDGAWGPKLVYVSTFN